MTTTRSAGGHVPALFPPTSWTLIRQIQREGQLTAPAREALDQLCRSYWEPVRRFFLALGCLSGEAADVTQDFFASFLERGGFGYAEQEKGCLRTLLKEAARRQLASHWRKVMAIKRGGGKAGVPLTETDDAALPQDEPADAVYDREWAAAILDSALLQLRATYEARGRKALFEEIQPGLLSAGGLRDYAASAARMQVPEAQLRLAVYRCRQRLAEQVRQAVAATTDPGDVETELNYLLEILSRSGAA